MNSGFILLHRKMLENAIFYNANYYQIWCYILLKVNHKDTEIIWNGEKKLIKKGSGIFSQKGISEQLKISIGTVHNALKYLKSESQIEIKTTSKFTEIQVINWDIYQDIESILENRLKPKRKQNESTVKQTNMINMINMISIDDEALKFKDQFGEKTIKDFLDYWQEKDKSGKMRWEKQKTFEVSKRLARWKQNEVTNFGRNKIQKINGINGVIV